MFARLLILLLPFVLHAKMLEVGDRVEPRILKSQHETEYRLVNNGMWLITWDKESTHIANEYFKAHGMRDDQNLLVDVSQVPSGIMSLFVMPKMRRYEHAILLSHDEAYNLTLPYKEGCLTLLRIKDGSLTEIVFIADEETLKEFLK